jgi:hypothetical protein
MGKWDVLKLKNSGEKILITKGVIVRRKKSGKKN